MVLSEARGVHEERHGGGLEFQPDQDPLFALRQWYADAEAAMPADDAHAIALATVSPSGAPSVRIVLCRRIDARGGLHVYTNYQSRKALELDATGRAAAVFHWRPLFRQCRVEGSVRRADPEDSDAYWRSRPRDSQLSALASEQSRPIEHPDALDRRLAQLRAEYEGREIPRPGGWGGYILTPRAIELWVQGAARRHERIRFERSDAGWSGQWLAP